MQYTRREIGKLALSALPAAALLQHPLEALAQTTRKPNSIINGVKIGTITYSYRQMPDQSAEALLGYLVANGISQVEIMGNAVERFAGAPQAAGGGGFTVAGYDIDAAKRERLPASGGRACASLAELATVCDVALLAVFNTEQVEWVTDALIAARASGAPRLTIVCTSTCDPDRVAALAARTKAQANFIEMPISGTSGQVAHGDGVGLVAGERGAIDAIEIGRAHV